MAYSIAPPKPNSYHTLNYVGSRLLGLLGLASIVESAKVWVGFFREIVQLYQAWVRQPIYDLLMAVWPASLPTVPHLAVDVLIVWTAFFAATNYHVIREDGRNIFSHVYARENNLMRSRNRAIVNTLVKAAIIFLIGPVYYPALAIAARGPVITDLVVVRPRAILWYVAQQVGIIVFLLFVSYQMKLQGVI
jgi:hypothetical protein